MPKVTDRHLALAAALAAAVGRPGQNVETIAEKIAADEAAERAGATLSDTALWRLGRTREPRRDSRSSPRNAGDSLHD